MSPRDVALNALLMATEKLGRDELLVLVAEADRLVQGQEDYGELDLGKVRDWDREAEEEILDLLLYRAFKRLAKARGR